MLRTSPLGGSYRLPRTREHVRLRRNEKDRDTCNVKGLIWSCHDECINEAEILRGGTGIRTQALVRRARRKHLCSNDKQRLINELDSNSSEQVKYIAVVAVAYSAKGLMRDYKLSNQSSCIERVCKAQNKLYLQ